MLYYIDPFHTSSPTYCGVGPRRREKRRISNVGCGWLGGALSSSSQARRNTPEKAGGQQEIKKMRGTDFGISRGLGLYDLVTAPKFCCQVSTMFHTDYQTV
jgi:hypothetical protein